MSDLRDADQSLGNPHAELGTILTPGSIVITLNWDTMLERYAYLHDIPIRLIGDPDPSEVLILKLHGSIDWTLSSDAKKSPNQADYAVLRERIKRTRTYTLPVTTADGVLRTRALENWNSGWQRIKSRTRIPFIVTMSQGKADALDRIQDIWDSAYYALSSSKTIHVVGYSMPHDDVEVRALLRAGIERGSGKAKVHVRNPAPDVHDRIRNYLDRNIASDYVPFPGYH